MIPYSRQNIDEDDIEAVVTVLRSDWITQGPNVDGFEESVSRYCGVDYGVAVNSGTAALHAAFVAAGIQDGDEVIVPTNTFIATANAVLFVGARPVFCDIRMDTYNIDESKIAPLITQKTKAIVPVHFAGHPCDMDSIRQIAKAHNLLVISDACQALGASYQDKKVGSLSDITVFSFHPLKSITTGEGGIACTNNRLYYERMQSFRKHGVTKDKELLKKNDGPWYFEMQMLGYNYRITDIQCALGISQMKKLDRFISERKRVALFYMKHLKDVPGLQLPTCLDQVESAWHLFVVRVDAQIRKSVFEQLRRSGVGVQVHHVPIHHHPYYHTIGYKNTHLPNTDAYYESCISLPIYPGLDGKQLHYVVNQLQSILRGQIL